MMLSHCCKRRRQSFKPSLCEFYSFIVNYPAFFLCFSQCSTRQSFSLRFAFTITTSFIIRRAVPLTLNTLYSRAGWLAGKTCLTFAAAEMGQHCATTLFVLSHSFTCFLPSACLLAYFSCFCASSLQFEFWAVSRTCINQVQLSYQIFVEPHS